MSTQSAYISVSSGKLHYVRMGFGRRLLLAFHGYNNSASLFFPFQKYLEKDFTIISIDLPHHGKSIWADDILLKKDDLKDLVLQLTEEFTVKKISLMGYSMGGRICLTIAELLPQNIDRILLIAPDGLVFNPLYYFVTKTFIGKNIFKKFLTSPRQYLKFMEWLKEKNWIDAARYRFAMYYLESEKDRKFLLKVWPGMSLIIPDMKRLRKAIKKHHLPVYIFMGAYDKIIPLSQAHCFKKDMDSVQLFILNKGHRVFDADTLPQMANCLILETC